MLTPRRSAQLGLAAASLMLVTSITVLVAGASDSVEKTPVSNAAVQSLSHVTPLASGSVGSIQSDLTQQIAIDKE